MRLSRGEDGIDLLLGFLLRKTVLLNNELVQSVAVTGGVLELLGGDLVELGAEGSAGLLNVGHGDEWMDLVNRIWWNMW